jgi:hypothetical protein
MRVHRAFCEAAIRARAAGLIVRFMVTRGVGCVTRDRRGVAMGRDGATAFLCAQRARCDAAMRARAAALIVRFGFWPDDGGWLAGADALGGEFASRTPASSASNASICERTSAALRKSLAESFKRALLMPLSSG